ncbi:leucine-rich repeat neuronal protein 1-like [Amphibalanus amphitrite]|uniref:leucine-rich repeat neuronal protein 1-like n=1 Tax=Amphibalanus amphitrite TaxID=1232801 RepID=UPI001C924D99|nr:leucine-rich repeat neuronal protein 1-like [Amphibalanus amphitrite]
MCSRRRSLCWPLPLVVLPLLAVGGPAAARCPDQCRCRPHAVDCSSAHLSSVPISLDPRIHLLQLEDNTIASIADSLVFYQSLQELDLSGNNLTTLGEQQLSLQQQLHQLQLADNQLSELRRGALEGLGRLERLDLSGNKLSSLEDGVFVATPRLHWLSLARNSLRSLDHEALLGLGELEILDLSGNQLTRVPSVAFRHLGRLRTLKLADNQITEVAFHAFFLLRSLHELSLAGNQVTIIHAEAFSELHELRQLDLSSNQLDAFPATALAPLRLEELDAGDNLFPSLRPRHLDGLPRLRVVRFCGSERLTDVSEHAFSNNRLLEEVHLCENPNLRWLPRTAVDSLRRLRVLNIGGNGLETLQNMTSLLQRVETFNVSGNPLVCNCSARWLWELPGRVPNASAVSEVLCAGSGRLLSSLSEQDLDCGWWVAATIAAAASLLVTVCAAIVIVLVVRRRRYRDRSRSSVLGGTISDEKQRPQLTPAASAKAPDRSAARGHSHFTLLSEDYVTDRSGVGRGDYTGDCDGDYARVYDDAYMRDYSVKVPSVVV